MLGDVEVDWTLPTGYVIRSSHQADGRSDDVLGACRCPGRAVTGRRCWYLTASPPHRLKVRFSTAWKLVRLPTCTTSKLSSIVCHDPGLAVIDHRRW